MKAFRDNSTFCGADPLKETNPLSRAVVRLTLEFQADDRIASAVPLATGTGIVLRDENDRLFLVSAWHNLSGKNPESCSQRPSLSAQSRHSEAFRTLATRSG